LQNAETADIDIWYNNPNMKLRVSSVLGVLLQVVALVAVGWFLRGLAPSGAKIGVAQQALPAVAEGTVASEIFNPPDEFVGHVEPVQEVDLLPQIEGYLKEVKFAEGDTVKAGDLLFVIDDEQYAAREGVAKATLAQAKAKVEEAQAAVDRSQRYLKRLESADSRGITRTELDAAETGLAADRAALSSARASVSQAEAELASTAFALKHTKIHAPITGRIGKALMHAGDYVSPSKGALARIVQTDPVRVTFPITDREFLAWGADAAGMGAKISAVRRLRLRLADGSVYPSTGTWAFSDNEMNAETATLTVRALFENPTGALVPKAYVTVLTDESSPKPVPTVPFLAVAKSGGKAGLWILDGETVHFREIVTGGSANGRVRVLKGAQPGERIVVQGVHKLGDGAKVRLVPASDFH